MRRRKPQELLEKIFSSDSNASKFSRSALALVIALLVLVVGLAVLVHYQLMGRFLASTVSQIVTFVLAIIAIVFATIQFFDARDQSTKIEQVARSMSTRYIGTFPKDMDDIIDVIKSADRELLVISDFIDYGSYSRPEAHEKLFAELKKARERGVSVRCLGYGCVPAEGSLLSQFPQEKFSEIRDTRQFRHYFEVWAGVKPKNPEIGFTHAEFLERLNLRAKDYSEQLRDKGVEIRTLDEKVWLFFWLEDKQDAVFVFEDIGTEAQGLAFRTRDAKLVETFASLFERSWNEAEKPVANKVL